MPTILVLKDVERSMQLVHIETTELPRYFAVVSQPSSQAAAVSADGGLICTPQGTKVSLPPDACWRSTKVAVKVCIASRVIAFRLDTAFLCSRIPD